VDIPLDELQKLAGNASLSYAEGYHEDERLDQALIDEAVEQAHSAEVALVYICLPPTKESEGYDRPDLDLTVQQVRLIQAITAAQPNTVVILNNGAPVVMDAWIGGTAAVLEAWMMGQAGGGAIADILYGKVNPSGKLAETFPIRLEDTPAFINYPGECGEVRYGEGVYVGYRYYDARHMPVLFPFGYGLSYTTFTYSNPRVSSAAFRDIDGVKVSVDVTNTGEQAGKEIVQVYVHDQQSELSRPPKELKGFAKVELQPGQTKTVTIPLDFRSFAYYNPTYRQWVTEDGDFEILIGASSRDIRYSQKVTVQSTVQLPCLLSRESTMREWLADRQGKQILASFVEGLPAPVQADFYGTNHEDLIGMDPNGFFMDMPLPGRLNFLRHTFSSAPEEVVDELLAKVRDSGDSEHEMRADLASKWE
jgi:beta-glucosidase